MKKRFCAIFLILVFSLSPVFAGGYSYKLDNLQRQEKYILSREIKNTKMQIGQNNREISKIKLSNNLSKAEKNKKIRSLEADTSRKRTELLRLKSRYARIS